jgi:hypothetical protein
MAYNVLVGTSKLLAMHAMQADRMCRICNADRYNYDYEALAHRRRNQGVAAAFHWSDMLIELL